MSPHHPALPAQDVHRRHAANPKYYDPPEVYTVEPKNRGIRDYPARLDGPRVHSVDADSPRDQVYEEVKAYVLVQLNAGHGV